MIRDVRGIDVLEVTGLACVLTPDFEVKIENAEIVGAFTESPDKSNDQPNTIGVVVEFMNLSADKDRVLREAFRVLKPGGRFAVSDVVVRGEVPAEVRRKVGIGDAMLRFSVGIEDAEDLKRD